MPKLPNFFLAGAPKAGTTSLYHYLDQHPQIFMSSIKEPHFFATDIRAEHCEPAIRHRMDRDNRALRDFLDGPMIKKRFGGIVTGWEDYLRLFANATDESALGEASVCYLWSATAAAGISEKIPNAKILVMLRHPAERAFSQYLQGLGNGDILWSFREHVRRNLDHRSGLFCVHYPFLEFGLYFEQLNRYRKLFGQNIWIGFYDDFKSDPLRVFRDICQFLRVTPEFVPDMAHRHLEPQVPRIAGVAWLKRSGLWKAAARMTPRTLRPSIRRSLVRRPGTTQMDTADRQYVVDFYREDIQNLAILLDRDLDAWLR